MIDEIFNAMGDFIGLILDDKEYKNKKIYKIIIIISVILILFLIGLGIYVAFFR